MIEIIAHRGYTEAGCIENTFDAFKQAFDRNIDGIEFDVHRTKDGYWVIHHDKDIGTHRISLTKLNILKKASLENGFELPLLENILKTFFNYQINIECKPNDAKLGSDLAILVGEKGNLKRLNISSFHIKSLKGINDKNSSIRLSYLLTTSLLSKWEKYNSDLNFYSINPNYIFLSNKLVQKIHLTNTLVMPWTVNNPNAVTRMIKLGVDKIITDRPTLCKRIVQSRYSRYNQN